MKREWRRAADLLVESRSVTVAEPAGPTSVVVELRAAPLDHSDRRLCGVGNVVATGPEATALQGRRVLVPAMIPGSEDRDAPLSPVDDCGPHGIVLRSHVVCPARWVLPLDEGLDVPLPLGALVGRELADAYALLIEGNVAPRSPVVVVGSGACAQLVAQLVRIRGCTPVHLTPEEPGRSLAELDERDRVSVLVAASAAAELDVAAWVLGELTRPSVAILGRGVDPAWGPLPLARIATRGTRVIGTAGAHPDLMAELAALVVRGDVDLSRVATAVPLGAPLPANTAAVSLATPT